MTSSPSEPRPAARGDATRLLAAESATVVQQPGSRSSLVGWAAAIVLPIALYAPILGGWMGFDADTELLAVAATLGAAAMGGLFPGLIAALFALTLDVFTAARVSNLAVDTAFLLPRAGHFVLLAGVATAVAVVGHFWRRERSARELAEARGRALVARAGALSDAIAAHAAETRARAEENDELRREVTRAKDEAIRLRVAAAIRALGPGSPVPSGKKDPIVLFPPSLGDWPPL